MAQTESLNII